MSNQHEKEDLGFLTDLIEAARTDEPVPADYHDARRRLLQRLDPPETEGLFATIIGASMPARLGRVTVTGAILGLAALLVLNPFGGSSGQVYANIVEQLRNAVTVAFTADMYFEGQAEPTRIEMAFREPGLQRTVMTYDGSRIVQINDTGNDRGLILIPAQQTYLETDLATMPSVERERVGLISMLTEEIKNLPAEADEILIENQDVDNRPLRAFHTGNKTMWIDEKREELVQMELDMGGVRMVMRNFRLDPEDLDEAQFSLIPPADYTQSLQGTVEYDMAELGAADVIAYLSAVVEAKKDHRFPEAINPMEFLSLAEQGLLIEVARSPEEEEEYGQAFAQASQRAMMFVMGMKPENDWHYAGKDVPLGDANTPIAWYRPDGSDAYRVIWGDLSTGDEADWDVRPVAR